MASDYYKTLGIEKSASKEDVKKAFHKLAHKYHPDKKGGDEKKFKEINEAYQVLSDDKKRAQYDTYGNAFSGGGGSGQGGFSGADFSGMGFDFSDLFRQGGVQFESGGAEFGDIFENFFGGGRQRREKVKRGRDISIDIQISFSEALMGAEKRVSLNKVGVCDTCKGSGAKQGSKNVKCKTCDGKGKIFESRRSFLGTFSTERACDNCFGKGEAPEEKCKDCAGAGILKKNEEIVMNIPSFINNGETLKMTGKGESVSAGIPGDLLIRISIKTPSKLSKKAIELINELKKEGI